MKNFPISHSQNIFALLSQKKWKFVFIFAFALNSLGNYLTNICCFWFECENKCNSWNFFVSIKITPRRTFFKNSIRKKNFISWKLFFRKFCLFFRQNTAKKLNQKNQKPAPISGYQKYYLYDKNQRNWFATFTSAAVERSTVPVAL